MIKAKTNRSEYIPGQKMKLYIGFTNNTDMGYKKLRLCTVVRQHSHVVHMVFDLNGNEISTSMTPWEIQHNTQ